MDVYVCMYICMLMSKVLLKHHRIIYLTKYTLAIVFTALVIKHFLFLFLFTFVLLFSFRFDGEAQFCCWLFDIPHLSSSIFCCLLQRGDKYQVKRKLILKIDAL